MNRKEIINKILVELQWAENLHPVFPIDIIRQVAIMVQESGEVVRAANQFDNEGGSLEDVRKELTQTAAMCIRVLENLESGLCHSCGRPIDYSITPDYSVMCFDCLNKKGIRVE